MTDKEKLEAIRVEIHRLVNVRGYDREMANDLFTFMDSLPNEPVSEELEEAAVEICSKVLKGETIIIDGYEYVVLSDAEECFKAGAEWMANQGVTVEGYLIQDIEEGNGDFLCSLEYIPYNSEFNKDGEKIIAQIRKKE